MVVVKKLWRMLTPFHGTIGVFFIFIAIYEGVQIVAGYTNSLIIRWVGEKVSDVNWIYLFGGLAVFNVLFMLLDNYLDWYIISRLGYPVFKFLKTEAVQKFLEMDIPWHRRHNSGALVGKVSNGVGKVNDIVNGLSWEFVPTIIQTILSLVPIVFLSSWAVLIDAIAFVVFLWQSFEAIKAQQPYRKKRHDLYEDEWHKSVELVQTVETTYMFGQKKRLLAELGKIHDQIVQLGLDEARLAIYKFNRRRISILNAAQLFILIIWAMQLREGSLDTANFVFISMLNAKLFASFWRFAKLFDRLAEGSESATRVEGLLAEIGPDTTTGLTPEITGPVGVKMENVNFAYCEEYSEGDGVLHNFNLEAKPGEIVAIVGPSGAGKTTLRLIMTGLIKIQSGIIKIGNLSLADWCPEAVLKMFSYVPQGDDVDIFADTIFANIAFPKPSATIEEVVSAAKLAGIHDFIASLPEGYLTQVGERGKRLSGGQKQRIALARAILADCPIWILDEATSALDSITEEEIQRNLQTILKGKTVFIIAHRLATIWGMANKIVVMNKGRVEEQGTHEELMGLNGLYKSMADLQMTQKVHS